AEQGLPGAVAKDISVVPWVGCHESTVRPDGPGDYRVDCTATYSDRSTADGYATVELTRNEVLFEPAAGDGGARPTARATAPAGTPPPGPGVTDVGWLADRIRLRFQGGSHDAFGRNDGPADPRRAAAGSA